MTRSYQITVYLDYEVINKNRGTRQAQFIKGFHSTPAVVSQELLHDLFYTVKLYYNLIDGATTNFTLYQSLRYNRAHTVLV